MQGPATFQLVPGLPVGSCPHSRLRRAVMPANASRRVFTRIPTVIGAIAPRSKEKN